MSASISPLAPKSYPAMPVIEGVRMATAEAACSDTTVSAVRPVPGSTTIVAPARRTRSSVVKPYPVNALIVVSTRAPGGMGTSRSAIASRAAMRAWLTAMLFAVPPVPEDARTTAVASGSPCASTGASASASAEGWNHVRST